MDNLFPIRFTPISIPNYLRWVVSENKLALVIWLVLVWYILAGSLVWLRLVDTVALAGSMFLFYKAYVSRMKVAIRLQQFYSIAAEHAIEVYSDPSKPAWLNKIDSSASFDTDEFKDKS